MVFLLGNRPKDNRLASMPSSTGRDKLAGAG